MNRIRNIILPIWNCFSPCLTKNFAAAATATEEAAATNGSTFHVIPDLLLSDELNYWIDRRVEWNRGAQEESNIDSAKNKVMMSIVVVACRIPGDSVIPRSLSLLQSFSKHI